MDKSIIYFLSILTTCYCQCVFQIHPTNTQQYFDLSDLSSDNTDYIVNNPAFPNYNFYINVCKSIVDLDETCFELTGICEKSSIASSRIGAFNTTFQITEQGLSMLYLDGIYFFFFFFLFLFCFCFVLRRMKESKINK